MEQVKPNIPKILVIDDDDLIRRLLLDLFRESYDCRAIAPTLHEMEAAVFLVNDYISGERALCKHL